MYEIEGEDLVASVSASALTLDCMIGRSATIFFELFLISRYTGIATVLSILGVLVYSYASVYCVPTPSVPETEIEKVEELKVPRSVYQSQDGRSITVYSKADKQRTSSVYSISMNHVVDEQALTAALNTTRNRSRLGSVELENMEEDLLDDCKKV